MAQAILPSPIGTIVIDCDERHVVAISIRPQDERIEPADGNHIAAEAAAQLAAYFDGRLKIFDLPLRPLASPRGAILRQAICDIAYGDTQSYGAVARRADSGPRALGQACRRNPLPVIVPCHRVTASGGAIGYYSGGKGVETKLWLIHHEAGCR
jgi:methylated-DNA-[protein]-cysteine S-methyltransferase